MPHRLETLAEGALAVHRTDEAVDVRDSRYIAAHGKSPKGDGRWAFVFVIAGKETAPVFIQGKYGAAKKEAVKRARKAGASTVYVES